MEKEDLHIFSFALSDDSNIEYSEKLFGGYGIFGNGNDSQSLYADRICYDVTGGIFYYHAENKYYPVQNVSIAVKVQEEDGYYEDYYPFTFDNNKNVYLNMSAQENWEQLQNDEYISDWENKYEITFNMFDGTELDHTKWTNLIFDDIRELDASELTLIDSKSMAKSSFVAVDDAYLDENYTLHVYPKNNAKTYFVVSYIDKNVLEAEKQEFLSSISEDSWSKKLEAVISCESVDLYVLAEVFVDALYDMKEEVLGVMLGTFLLAIISFVFLMCAAGHRRNKEEIVLTFIDKIPLDIVCVAVFFAEVFLACVLEEIIYLGSAMSFYKLYVAIGIMMVSLVMVAFLSIAVRVKMGKWWRNSATYWIWTKIVKMLRKVWSGIKTVYRNIGILWKVIAGVVVYSALQLFAIGLIEPSDGDIAAALFFLEKLILCPLLFLIVIQFKKLQDGSRLIAEGNLEHKIDTSKMFWEFKKHADNLNSISEGMSHAVDERMKSERFKTELITNVSHDIKTPLTSIINYVDLLEKTDIQDETAREYLEILERQSSKLKKLIEDLIEASKASTGNLSVNIEELEADVFVTQIIGEFEERLANAGWNLL